MYFSRHIAEQSLALQRLWRSSGGPRCQDVKRAHVELENLDESGFRSKHNPKLTEQAGPECLTAPDNFHKLYPKVVV